ncbi:MAG: hypothetical protein IKH75_01100 [Ruminococcus sp.]|nr:hypothetical protein [Ruminococcus sp.]
MPIAISGFERLAGEILSIYAEAEETMLHRVASHLGRGTASERWADRKYSEAAQVSKEMQKVIKDLKAGRTSIYTEAVQSAWDSSSKQFVTDAHKIAEAYGIAAIAPNAPKVISILSELDNTYAAEDCVILRKINDAYADIIGRCTAKVATGTITYRDAVKHELEEFAKKGISGFVDKNGHSWDMATYAEMATLTAIERATLYGYVDTMQEYGYDLAIISSHAGACPLCVSWEDVIVSVSGNDLDYPSLDDAIDAGCFHPRCLHYLSTYYPGITEGGRNAPRPVEEPSNEYSSRQLQRYYERKIREWKRRMAVATDPKSEREAYARVRMYQYKVRMQIKNYDSSDDQLMRKYWREGGRQTLTPEARRLKPVRLSR